jgi:HSP20 family protein
MTLVKWNPSRSLFNFREDLWDNFFNSDHFLTRNRESWYPAVDIEEDKDNYHVTMELPGLNKEDVNISFEDGVLVVRGEKKEEKEDKDRNYHCYERRYGKFERAFRIHSDVEKDKIDATFKNGVLSIEMPKAEKAKAKQIEVKVK